MENRKHKAIPATAALAAALIMYGVGPTDGAPAPAGEPASGPVVLARAASGSAAGPRCAPSRLNRSAVLPGTRLAVSPLPDSYDANAGTQISMLGPPGTRLSGVRVHGARTGSHPGSLRAYSQGDGASFVPSRPFDPGESVFVRGNVRSASRTARFSYRFAVARQDTSLAVPASARARAVARARAKPRNDFMSDSFHNNAPSGHRSRVCYSQCLQRVNKFCHVQVRPMR